jgi:hypothetical protein
MTVSLSSNLSNNWLVQQSFKKNFEFPAYEKQGIAITRTKNRELPPFKRDDRSLMFLFVYYHLNLPDFFFLSYLPALNLPSDSAAPSNAPATTAPPARIEPKPEPPLLPAKHMVVFHCTALHVLQNDSFPYVVEPSTSINDPEKT